MKNKQYDNELPGRRFSEKVDGPVIRRLYAKMPTAELAERIGLTVKQIKNFVYRMNPKAWARKAASTLSRINSVKGKMGGRPRKKKS